MNSADNSEMQEVMLHVKAFADAGQFSQALENIERVIALDSECTEAYLLKAQVLQSLMQLPAALNTLQLAASLEPDRPDVYCAIGQLLLSLTRFADAQVVFTRAVNLDSESAAAHEGLGTACLRLGNLELAERHYREALQYNASLPGAHRSLGKLLRAKGYAHRAREHMQQAVALDPADLPALTDLCLLFWETGEIAKAVKACLEVLARAPNSLSMRQLFPLMLRNLQYPQDMLASIRAEIIHTFSMRNVDYETLFLPAMQLLQADMQLGNLLRSLMTDNLGQVEDNICSGKLSPLLSDELLLNTLQHTTVSDIELERTLVKIRHVCLNIAMNGIAPGGLVDGDYAFPVSLACQCHHVEYCYVVDDREEGLLKNLEYEIQTDMLGPGLQECLSVLRVIVYAMYKPLNQLACFDQISKHWHALNLGALNLLLKRQVEDACREQQLRASIHTLTPVRLELSRAIESEYDASPYPRWLSTGTYAPGSCREIFRQRYPGFEDQGADPRPLQVLVAGCGTGRHAIVAASRFSGAQVLAVDLSMASLCYAQRVADELGVTNISFQQADIMELPATGLKFHVIEAGGVLHNMESPLETIGIFADILENHGLLYISTYRKAARIPVLDARAVVRENGISKAPDGIRQARQLVSRLAETNPGFRKMTKWRDFFTLNEARFLLFDVHEHTFEVDELYDMFEEKGLRVLGFDLETQQDMQIYRRLNPGDQSVSDRDKVRAFEIENPSSFSGQYRCWCQKK